MEETQVRGEKKNSIKRRGQVSQRKRARTQTMELALARRSNLSYTLRLQPKKTTGKQDPESPYDLSHQPQPGPMSSDSQSSALFTM